MAPTKPTTAFNETSTVSDVLAGMDLAGKTFLITGASAGLGLEAARGLAEHGAGLILAARGSDKFDGAVAALRLQFPAVSIDAVALDLADLASVRNAGRAIVARHKRIDVLINNAGVMACPLQFTVQGHELQFGVNHLGHCLLTLWLEPLLMAAAPARVVVLSSGGHKYGAVDFDDLDFKRRGYNKWLAYGQSKTANALFAVALSQHWGPRVLANAVHPGAIVTELGRHLQREDIEYLMKASPRAGKLTYKQPAAGAATEVWAATAPLLLGRGGLYLEDCGIADVADEAGSNNGYLPYALDPVAAERLWQMSLQVVADFLP